MNKAFEVANIIEASLSDQEQNFFAIGKALCLVSDEKLYLDYASHTTSMESFLKEFGFSRAWAFNVMRVYRVFGEYDCRGIAHDRLIKLLPLRLENKLEKEEWLMKCMMLTAQGFNDEVREAKGLIPTDKCNHEKVKTIKICCECKRRVS